VPSSKVRKDLLRFLGGVGGVGGRGCVCDTCGAGGCGSGLRDGSWADRGVVCCCCCVRSSGCDCSGGAAPPAYSRPDTGPCDELPALEGFGGIVVIEGRGRIVFWGSGVSSGAPLTAFDSTGSGSVESCVLLCRAPDLVEDQVRLQQKQ